MPPNSPASENKGRRTLKNVRGTWLEKGKRNITKYVKINPVTNSQGNFYRNVASLNALSKVGLRSSNRQKRNTANRRLTLKDKLSKNEKNAIMYRRFNTSSLTPQLRGHTRLSPTEAKVAANVYAAGAPEYNYQRMVDEVFNRTNINEEQQGRIADRLYELYGPNNNNVLPNNSDNENTLSPTGAVVNYVNEPVMPTARKQETGKRASLPAGW